MEAGVQLTNGGKNVPSSPYPYKEIVGLLMSAATATRPEIIFATSILGQFAQAPTKTHLEAAKWVVRYLKTTRDCELTYNNTNEAMVGYSDAHHASQLHRHSISGYVFLLGGGSRVELQEATYRRPIHDRGRIHRSCTRHEGGDVAPHFHRGDHGITCC